MSSSTSITDSTSRQELLEEFRQLNSLVAEYDDSRFDRAMRHWMWRTLEPWMTGQHALELGCLYGEFTSLLARRFHRVAVVDAAASFLDAAKKRVGSDHDCQLSFHQSLFETFEGEVDGGYDSIFLMHVLEHLIDPVSVLRAARRWLAPSGRMFLVVPNGNALSRQLAVRMGALRQLTDFSPADVRGGHRRVYLPDTLLRDARDAGLTVEHSGGIFLKPLANFQFDALMGGEFLSAQYMEACYELGKEYPTLCASLFLVCRS